MDINTALNILHGLIEQANAQGFFKKLDQLDMIREAEKTIKDHLRAAAAPAEQS